jgi:hypothetical protein
MNKEGKGYLIVADNTEQTDYVDCAIALARSIKLHTPNAKIALMTSNDVDNDIFDYVVGLPFGDQAPNSNWKLKNDWQIFWATPFKETIKLEADMIVPHSIEHWWDMFRKRDVVISVGAKNYLQQDTNVRMYRKIFDKNELPDVYNAITYFRYSQFASEFFSLVRDIFNDWDNVRTIIKGGDADPGTTDVVYAIAAKALGIENCTLPNTSYPKMIHMKGAINFMSGEDWTQELIWEFDKSNIRINTIDQEYPVHYQVKEFSKKLNEYYEQFFTSTTEV